MTSDWTPEQSWVSFTRFLGCQWRTCAQAGAQATGKLGSLLTVRMTQQHLLCKRMLTRNLLVRCGLDSANPRAARMI